MANGTVNAFITIETNGASKRLQFSNIDFDSSRQDMAALVGNEIVDFIYQANEGASK